MDEKIKDQEVLLVEEQKTESLRAVAGADETVSYTHLTLPTIRLV